MMTPNPSINKTVSKPMKSTGSLKRDVNLLPVNVNTDMIARNGTTILAVFVGLVLLGYFAIYMPMMMINDQQTKAANAENQLLQYKPYESEFESLIAQRNDLKGMIDSLDKTGQSYLQPADLYKHLAQACPQSITLTSVALNDTGLMIVGAAVNDDDIAQFIVNLKTLPQYQQVYLVSTQENTAVQKSAYKRVFAVNAVLPPSASPAASAPSATIAPASTAKGGDGK